MPLIDQIIGNIGKAVAPIAKEAAKGAEQHLAKHGSKYFKAIGCALVAGVSYLGGKIKGFTQGKKAGIVEQAKRDEEKLRQQAKAHNEDRKNWRNQKKKYEDLLKDIEQN